MSRQALIGTILAFSIVALPVSSHAEGQDAAYPWATPGQVRWLIDYSKMEEPHVRLMLEARFNLIQGGGFTPEALKLARSTPGVHTMQYICSRTIYHEKLFKSNPELKDAAIRNPDGSYKIIYNNPARYAGCYNREAWMSYIKAQMDNIHEHGVDCIFFDNPMTWACYCPTCQGLFLKYSKEKTGREVKLGESGKPTELENWFTVDTAERWFRQIHDHARGKRMFIVANNLTYWLVSKGVTDGVFTEAGGHPPFAQDIASYKIGLAASHGRPTGILDYVPGAVKKARGKEVFNHSRGSGQKWVGAPVAEEFELGYAQGLACGGNYIANYSLELGRRIEQMTDPEDRRIQAALVKYGSFARDHAEVHAQAWPAATVAVLHSLSAGPREGHILGTNRGATNKVLWTLIGGGVPADVIVEDGLTPERMASIRGAVVNDVPVLEPEAAAGLGKFVRDGGTLVLAGGCSVRSRYEDPAQARPLSAFLPGLAQVDSFTYGPNDMQLDGYQVAMPYLKLETTGRATAAFKSAPGSYRVAVSYLDENDGQGRFELVVDGKQVGQWPNNADDDKVHTYVSPAVALKTGSSVTVIGHAGGGEYGRIQRMKITTDSRKGNVSKCKVGGGTVLQLADPIPEAMDAEREEVLTALRELCPVTGKWPGKLLVNLTRAGPQGPICVHLVNYDFRYEEKYVLQSIQPAGPLTLSVRGAKEARLLSPDGGERSLEVKDGVLIVPEVKVYSALLLQ